MLIYINVYADIGKLEEKSAGQPGSRCVFC
jgi:hypothetical protein